MKKLTESKLLAGFIYGDHHTKEYVYLPGSELDEALDVIEKRSLKPTTHPIFGKRTL